MTTTKTKMNPEFKTALLKAARSGKYKKITGYLKKKDHLGNGFCWLGLMLNTAFEMGKGHWAEHEEMQNNSNGVPFYWGNVFYDNKSSLPSEAFEYMGVDGSDPTLSLEYEEGSSREYSAAQLNDDFSICFPEFADLVDDQW